MKKLIANSFFRYFIAVGCGYCLDFSIYVILINYFNYSIYWANGSSFCVGAIVNVFLIRWFVFPDSRFSIRVDLPLALLVNVILLSIGMFFLWILVHGLGIGIYWGKLLSNGITFIMNYMVRKFFFRRV